MASFTTQIPDLANVGPIISITLAPSMLREDLLRARGQSVPSPMTVSAMIDIGSSATVIREDLAQQLKLELVGSTLINTPSSTDVFCCEYFARLSLPHDIVFENVVIAAPLQKQNVECLIGRDILQHGVLVYIGHNDSFTLSF